ncbi:hypothetical protein KIPB_001411 [Kipferlia bialata]|uniref:Uncharacterized protein n=1 Tax=Kipferlia bialata TaxID=797122 RepID=A0A9K3CNT7_9EUKA|nr:hypothetical protein KIPB_000191 [Kipferlia bialata]GIQ80586.1 hypothetical protein KIPB_001411 [Kipferlia bialata]|eukprot:g191.t1
MPGCGVGLSGSPSVKRRPTRVAPSILDLLPVLSAGALDAPAGQIQGQAPETRRGGDGVSTDPVPAARPVPSPVAVPATHAPTRAPKSSDSFVIQMATREIAQKKRQLEKQALDIVALKERSTRYMKQRNEAQADVSEYKRQEVRQRQQVLAREAEIYRLRRDLDDKDKEISAGTARETKMRADIAELEKSIKALERNAPTPPKVKRKPASQSKTKTDAKPERERETNGHLREAMALMFGGSISDGEDLSDFSDVD